MRPRLSAVLLGLLLLQLANSTTATAAAPTGWGPTYLPAGFGIRGTVAITWGNVSGAPITAWNGRTDLAVDPTAAARADTMAALAQHGEPFRTVRSELVHAVRVTSLTSDKAETVLCTGTDADGNMTEWSATATESTAGIVDARVAFEVTTPRLDMLRGTGTITLNPYTQMNDDGWWLSTRLVLPGRHTATGSDPCPGAGQPAGPSRIFAANGGGAVPVAITDWIDYQGRRDWRLRRDATGWRVLLRRTWRETFSERRFGPQDTQQLDISVDSNLYLAGTLHRMGARCRVPTLEIERARTPRAAVALAIRAGLRNVRYGGVRKSHVVHRTKYFINGTIDSQSHAPCLGGRYVITKVVPVG